MTVSASTKSGLRFHGDSPACLELTCKIEARLSEYQRPPSLWEMEHLRAEVEARERARLEEALDQLRAWSADCAGLGAKAAMTRPAQWQKIQSNWPVWFSQLPIKIRVEIKLDS